MELTLSHNKTQTQVSSKKDKNSFFSFGHDTDSVTPFFQPKLSVNSPGDVYEKQADEVAEQVMNHAVETVITPVAAPAVSNKNIQRDGDGPRREEQNPVTDGLSAVGENLMDNNPLFQPFLDNLKLRLWTQQPAALRGSIIGFGIADALMVGSVFALDPTFRAGTIRALDGVNLMTPIRLIPHADLFTPSSFSYHLPDASHPSYEFNGQFDLTPYFDLLHEHNAAFPQISPRFGLNLDYNPATRSLRVVGGTFNLDLFNRAITLQGGINQFFNPDPQFFMPQNPMDSPVTSMLSLPSQQIRDTRFSLTIDVPRLINVIRGVRNTPPVQRKVMDDEKEEEVQRKEDVDEETLQTKNVESGVDEMISRKEGNGVEANSLQSVEQTLASNGNSLDDETRSYMEERFNYDFSDVKIHDDSTAHQSSADINALAYTHQNHIAFGSGQYNPSSAEGKKLLAHELTHVVQQGEDIKREVSFSGIEPVAGRLIVDETSVPANGQMRRADFLEEITSGICTTVDEGLAGTEFSSDNCPFIRLLVSRLQRSSPNQLEQMIALYSPAAVNALTASEYIPFILAKVQADVAEWKATHMLPNIQQGIIEILGESLATVLQEMPPAIDDNSTTETSVTSRTETVQSKTAEGQTSISGSPQKILQSLGDGEAISTHTRSRMESGFGSDFSDVRVHTDDKAATHARDLNARAFAVGNHIAFASGQHQPGTMIGDALMAHELAHVQQQRGADILAKDNSGGDGNLESDADTSAVHVVARLWNKTTGYFKNLGKEAMPRLKTGLKLQSCGYPGSMENLSPQEQQELREDILTETHVVFDPNPEQGEIYAGTNFAVYLDRPFTTPDEVYPRMTFIEITFPDGNVMNRVPDSSGISRVMTLGSGETIIRVHFMFLPGMPAAMYERRITVRNINDLAGPVAQTDLTNQTVGTSLANELIGYEAQVGRLRRNAQQYHIAEGLIDTWFSANESAILIETALANGQPVSATLSTQARVGFRRFYQGFRSEVASLDHEEETEPDENGMTSTYTANPYVTQGQTDYYFLRTLDDDDIAWGRKISNFITATKDFDKYIASRFESQGLTESASQLRGLSSYVGSLREIYRNHPNATPVKSVFYPSEQAELPHGAAIPAGYHPQKYDLHFFVYRTGPSTDITWHLIDVTNPNDVHETEEDGGTTSVPPRSLFTELDDDRRLPLGILYWQLPGQTMDHHDVVHPITWSAFLSYIGIAATVIGVTFLTSGAGTAATVMFVAGGLAAAASAGLDIAERSNLGVLTASDVIVNTITIVTSLAGASAAVAGRIVAVGAGATGTFARVATSADRIYRTLAGINLVGDLISLGIFTHDFAAQLDAITANAALTGDQRNTALTRLILQGLLTGGLTLLAVRGDAADFTRGRSLYLETSPRGVTARLILNDADLLSHASVRTGRADLEQIIHDLEALPTSGDALHKLRGEISSAISTGLPEQEIHQLIADLRRAGTDVSAINRLVEDFRLRRTAAIGGVRGTGSYDLGSFQWTNNTEFQRQVQGDFGGAGHVMHNGELVTQAGTAYTLRLDNPTAGQPRIEAHVEIRYSDFSTPAGGTSAHVAEQGPARYSLLWDSTGSRWVAEVHIDQRLLPTDIRRALGHELDEISDIIHTQHPNAATLTPDELQAIIHQQQQAGVFRPDIAVPVGTTGIPNLTAHDRAAARELDLVLGEVERGVSGSQARLRAVLGEMGFAVGQSTSEIIQRIRALEGSLSVPKLASLEFEVAQIRGSRSQFTRAEFTERYNEGLRFDIESGRWYSVEGPARTRQYFTDAELANPRLAFTRIAGPDSTSSFKQYFDMLIANRIATEVEVRNRLEILLRSTRGRDLDFVRHELKMFFRQRVIDFVTDRARLATKYRGVGFEEATHREMLTITENLNPADKGALAEIWYRTVFAPTAQSHIRVTDAAGGVRYPDLLKPDGTLQDLKHIAGLLSDRELEQFTAYRGMIGRDVTFTAADGTTVTQRVNRLRYSFFNPEGVAANAGWMNRTLSSAAGVDISFEIFNAAGQRRLVTSGGVFDSAGIRVAGLTFLTDTAQLRTWLTR